MDVLGRNLTDLHLYTLNLRALPDNPLSLHITQSMHKAPTVEIAIHYTDPRYLHQIELNYRIDIKSLMGAIVALPLYPKE